MRQADGSIVCAECSRLVGVNEERCPYCGAWRPGLFGWAPFLRALVGTGYAGAYSLECRWRDQLAQAPPGVAELRRQLASVVCGAP